VIVMTSQKIRTHGVYIKRWKSSEWAQYFEAVYREYRVFGFPVWRKTLAKCDRSWQQFIRDGRP